MKLVIDIPEKMIEGVKNECDGWCTNGLYINGKKINERAKTYKHSGCRNWIEVETGITHFEATTRIPEHYRTDAEKVYISTLLKGGADMGYSPSKESSPSEDCKKRGDQVIDWILQGYNGATETIGDDPE